ncbi:MAG: hypothetical protein V2B19_12805 [Pseudomonadota bacterium]
MKLESITTLLNRPPAVKLLRAHHSPLIIGFLYRTIYEKQSGKQIYRRQNYAG